MPCILHVEGVPKLIQISSTNSVGAGGRGVKLNGGEDQSFLQKVS
jgi:hypothetical protein